MRTLPSILPWALGLLLTIPLAGKPARKEPVHYRQPDGTVVEVRLHGDEWGHFATDAAGRALAFDANGFLRLSGAPQVLPRRAGYGPRQQTSLQPPRILVIPIEFDDVRFGFDNLQGRLDSFLNQAGYAEGGALGSVADYFADNSLGQYRPVFEVTAPVRLAKSVSAYGADEYQGGVRIGDKAPELALYEACLALDQEVDFSRYDTDGDGVIDMVYYFYAGLDQADGGARETIWSHQWDARGSSLGPVLEARFDGKALGYYCCTSELAGEEGRFCQLAPCCHELAHVLGLPDFYDTDGTQNGLAGALYGYSLMSDVEFPGGNPPYLNAQERVLLGWMRPAEFRDFPEEGSLLIGPVQENLAYWCPTSTEGERFLYEYRSGKGWDAGIPEGLLVYHLDQSERVVLKDLAASFLWDHWRDYNNLNANGLHPCFYLIPSCSPTSLQYQDDAGIVFPGIGGVLSSDPLDWAGAYLDIQLTSIHLEPEGVGLYVLRGHDANLNGRVMRRDASPVSGASVSVDVPDAPQVLTGPDGFFFLPLPEGTRDGRYTLTVSRAGYRKQQQTAVQQGRSACAFVFLTLQQEPDSVSLMAYDPQAERLFFPLPSQSYGDCMGAVRFRAETLFPHAGRRLSSVRFFPYLPDGYPGAEAVWVVVDFGTRRVLTRKVDNPVQGMLQGNFVDLSDADLRLPEGEDVYIGYGVEGASYPFMLGAALPGHVESSYYAPLDLEASSWIPMYTQKGGVGYMDLLLSAEVAEIPDPASLAEMGYAAIDPGKGNWRAGDRFPLHVLEASGRAPKSVSWTFDGEPVGQVESVLLPAGEHRISALLRYEGKASEKLSLHLSVWE